MVLFTERGHFLVGIKETRNQLGGTGLRETE